MANRTENLQAALTRVSMALNRIEAAKANPEAVQAAVNDLRAELDALAAEAEESEEDENEQLRTKVRVRVPKVETKKGATTRVIAPVVFSREVPDLVWVQFMLDHRVQQHRDGGWNRM